MTGREGEGRREGEGGGVQLAGRREEGRRGEISVEEGDWRRKSWWVVVEGEGVGG